MSNEAETSWRMVSGLAASLPRLKELFSFQLWSLPLAFRVTQAEAFLVTQSRYSPAHGKNSSLQ